MNGEEQKKPKITSKSIFYIAGLVSIFAFIILSAWWDLVFGVFDVVAFVSEALILVAIGVGTMPISSLSSQEFNMNRMNGLFNVTLNEYQQARQSIEAIIIYFSQWHSWWIEEETFQKRQGFLMINGVDGQNAYKIARYARMEDYQRLCEEKEFVKEIDNGKKIVLRKLETEEQRQAALYVLQGKADIKDNNYSDYLFNFSSSEANMRLPELKEFYRKRAEAAQKRAYIMNVIRIIGTSILFVALVPADEEEVASKNRWWSFVKRIGVFMTSFINGWLAGSSKVSSNATIIKQKVSVLETYKKHYDEKIWSPVSQEEMDARLISEYENNALRQKGETNG